jgi:hypothetical protein
MRKVAITGLVLGALLASCEARTDQRGNASGRGGGPTQAAEGTGDALRAAGHGVVYGVRELGQTMSGTQGNPEAEARSQAERRAMQQSAASANQHFDNAAERARVRIHEATAPRDEPHRSVDDRAVHAPNDR